MATRRPTLGGHGFSRAVRAPRNRALAPEVLLVNAALLVLILLAAVSPVYSQTAPAVVTAVDSISITVSEYLAPRDGRPYPLDTRANDLWSWQTHLVTADAEAANQRLRGAHSTFVSAGTVALPKGELGFGKGLTVRDPDGHALQLVQR